MESIFIPEFKNPQVLHTDNFVIFPTDQALYESDHAAVMKSKNILRIWSQSAWPEDDFSVEQNKEDLVHHVQDNINHAAYGYMIYSPDRKTCYGSLYVNPLLPVLDNYSVDGAVENLIRSHHARIDFWVIEGEPLLEKIITQSLCDWFGDVWKIKPSFSARLGMDQRMQIYKELGFTQGAMLRSRTSDINLLLYFSK